MLQPLGNTNAASLAAVGEIHSFDVSAVIRKVGVSNVTPGRLLWEVGLYFAC
jgi:hypothetical protein